MIVLACQGADIITTRDTLRDEALEEETGRERQEGKEDEGKGDKGEEEEEECSICMCTVTGEAEAASLDNCVHAFHFGCITKVRAMGDLILEESSGTRARE